MKNESPAPIVSERGSAYDFDSFSRGDTGPLRLKMLYTAASLRGVIDTDSPQPQEPV